MKRLGSQFLFVLVVVAEPGWALRCGQYVVSEGLRTFEVAERCGYPEYQHSYVAYRGFDPGDRGGFEAQWPVQIDEWVYDLGSTKFRRMLVFENGRLIRIETLGKGAR